MHVSSLGSRAAALGLVALTLLIGCEGDDLTPAEQALLAELGPLGEPPASPSNAVADDERAAELGAWLFHDDEVSQTGSMSCADCHQPMLGWSDDRALSGKQDGSAMPRHSQSLTNVAYQDWLFWDGRADTLWSQAYGALGAVHAIDPATIVGYLAADDWYAQTYAELFGSLPDPVSASADELDLVIVNCAKALEAYQRTLVSRDSALDRWIEGDPDALTEQQLRGARIFVGEGGCDDCHSGPNLSDGWFHNLGLAPGVDGRDAAQGLAGVLSNATNSASAHSDEPEWGATRLAELEQRLADEGDALVGAHKTPTLRDVALRPRFGHNGDVATLEEWIARYRDARVDDTAVGDLDPLYVPRDLSDSDIEDLTAFLEAMTGNPPSSELGY